MNKPKFNRSSGVLLNISSLPSEYGIGCFSVKDVENFVNMAVDMGFHWWQILPITKIGWGNSPYSGLSTYAGNSLYICPTELFKQGLLTESELSDTKYNGSPYTTDYDFAKCNSKKYLELAFARVDKKLNAEIEKFRALQSFWLEDYALYMAISQQFGTHWQSWEDDLKFRKESSLNKIRKDFKHQIDYYCFEQYEFYTQWSSIKENCNDRDMFIIGDLPFYVCTDSADVWANPQLFELDENLECKKVAGVPPDDFAEDGQLWGNCLYNFEEMKKDGFQWWRKRISHTLNFYNALRLDHFRAFFNYFSIPADEKTAKNGVWIDGPKEELLDLIRQDNPDGLFIAEDLGLIGKECRAFINSRDIPTMRVFQFGFDGSPNEHLPYRYSNNNVAYSGTHDNNTTLGWLYELSDSERQYTLKYCGFEGAGWGAGGPYCKSTKAIIKTIISSSAGLAILPVQDMLGYGSDTRMNIPGVAKGNWTYRLPYESMLSVDRDFFLDLNKTYGRLGGGIDL